MPGEVDDAGGDVHVHDPVHDLKTYRKYSVSDPDLVGTGTIRAWLIRIRIFPDPTFLDIIGRGI